MTHTLGLTLTNGNIITTEINGAENEIYKHYRNNNFQAWCSEDQTQVKRLEFISSPLLQVRDTGSIQRSKVYLFIDYEETGFYQ